MKTIVMFLLLLFCAGLSMAQDKESIDQQDQKLLNWMRYHKSLITGMPYSFEPLGIRRNVFLDIGSTYSTTGIIERTIVDQGISIYDAALWQIVLSQTGNQQDFEAAIQPDHYYWEGSMNELFDIRTGSGGQIFIYDPYNPDAVTSDLSKKGQRGFIFRILNTNGQYLASDPLDKKTVYEDFPNDPRIHWEDWKPIAGENAWVVMAALHHLMRQSKEDRSSSLEINLARELSRAAIYLQAENGGIRMAPLGTYYHLLDIKSDFSEEKISQALDETARRFKHGFNLLSKDLERIGAVDYPPYHTWYYEEISTENNLSWYAAFKMMYKLTGQPEYSIAIKKIENYIKSMWNPGENIFYQGAHFIKGRWVPNLNPFAVDVQNWAIIVIGPQKIDEWFGEGCAYKIWCATKNFSGIYSHQNLLGVGFTKEKDRLSIEWTAGAILAARKLAGYYAARHPDWSAQAGKDALSMRLGVDDYYFNVRQDEAAFSYSSERRWIPFGWFSHKIHVLSLASSAWIYLIDQNTNPFEIL